MNCPCGNNKPYSQCCEPYILGKALPATPELLMRSRYSAYVKHQDGYLLESLAPEARSNYDAAAAQEWSRKAEWLGLQIVSASGDQVAFTAKYKMDGKAVEHHEISTFKKIGDRWYFLDGKTPEEARAPIKREAPKVGRNDPCPCGSGKKSKKCCAA